MIERVIAKSGGTVLRFDGRLLASAVDPQGEARAWASRRQFFLSRVRTVFILGAGSGYHVAEIAVNCESSIVVLETMNEIADQVNSIHGFDPARIRFEIVGDLKGVRASETVRKGVAESFVVLTHPASVQTAPEFYRDCRALLLGRDWGSLNWQWGVKGHLAFETEPNIGGGDGPLTIYDLEQTELVQDSTVREKLLIKALRELLK